MPPTKHCAAAVHPLLPFTRCRSFADTVHLTPPPSPAIYPPPTCRCCVSVTAAHQPPPLICLHRRSHAAARRPSSATGAAHPSPPLLPPFTNRCHSPAINHPSSPRHSLLPPLAAHLSLSPPLIRTHRSPAAIAYLPPPIIDDSPTAAANVTPSVTPLNIRRHRSRASSVVIYPPLPLTSHRCSSTSAANVPQPPIIRGSHAAAG